MQQTKEEKKTKEYEDNLNQALLDETKQELPSSTGSFSKKELSKLTRRFNNLNSVASVLLGFSGVKRVPSLSSRDAFKNKKYSLSDLVKKTGPNRTDLSILKFKNNAVTKQGVSPSERALIRDLNSKQANTFKPYFYEAPKDSLDSQTNRKTNSGEKNNKLEVLESDILHSVLKKANAEESKFVESQKQKSNNDAFSSKSLFSKTVASTEDDKNQLKEDIWTYQPEQNTQQETFEDQEITRPNNRLGRSKFLVFSSLVLLASGIYWFNHQSNKKIIFEKQQDLINTEELEETKTKESPGDSEDEILDSLGGDQSSINVTRNQNEKQSQNLDKKKSESWYQPKASQKTKSEKQVKESISNTSFTENFPIAISTVKTSSLGKFPTQKSKTEQSLEPNRNSIEYYQSPDSYRRVKEEKASSSTNNIFSSELNVSNLEKEKQDASLGFLGSSPQKTFNNLNFPIALTMPESEATKIESIASYPSFNFSKKKKEEYSPKSFYDYSNSEYRRIKSPIKFPRSVKSTKLSENLGLETPYVRKNPTKIKSISKVSRFHSEPIFITNRKYNNRASEIRKKILKAKKQEEIYSKSPYAIQNKELSSIERDLVELEKKLKSNDLSQREQNSINSKVKALKERVIQKQQDLKEELERKSRFLEGEASSIYSGR